MPALTSLLVRDQVASIHKIEEALQRQVLEGGEIDTILLELGAVPENVLNAYRAALFNLAAASRHQLMSVGPQTLAKVSKEIAERFRVVPIAFQNNRLQLGISSPLPDNEIRELMGHLKVDLEFRVTTEVRVEAALAAHYGIEISGRLRLLALQLENTDPGALPAVKVSEEQKAIHFEEHFLDEFWSETLTEKGIPERTRERGLGSADEKSATSELGVKRPSRRVVFSDDDTPGGFQEEGTLKGVEPAPSGVAVSDDNDRIGSDEQETRRYTESGTDEFGQVLPDGEFEERKTLEGLSQPLASLRTVEMSRVVGVGEQTGSKGRSDAAAVETARGLKATEPANKKALKSERRYAPRGPLTPGVTRELLESADDRDSIVELFFSFAKQYFDCTVLLAFREDCAVGLEASGHNGDEDIRGVKLPLIKRGMLDDLQHSLLPRVTDLTRRKEDREFLSAFGRAGMRPVALLPICIRQRVVLLLYGDRAGEHFTLDDLSDVITLLPPISRAFERLIHINKVMTSQLQRQSIPIEASDSPDSQTANASEPIDEQHSAPDQLSSEGSQQQVTLKEGSDAANEITPIAAEPRRARHAAPKTLAGIPGKKATVPFEKGVFRARKTLSGVVTRERSTESDDASSEKNVSDRPGAVSPVRSSDAIDDDVGSNSKTIIGLADGESLGSAGRTSRQPVVSDHENDAKSPSTADVEEEAKTAYDDLDWGDASKTQDESLVADTDQKNQDEESAETLSPRLTVPDDRSQPSADQAISDPSDRPADPEAARIPVISEMVRWSDPPKEPPTKTEAVPDKRHTQPVAEKRSEPSIVVDMGLGNEALLEKLCSSGPGQEARVVSLILQVGDDILDELERRFPGPLWFNRKKPFRELPSGREVSAVSRAIIAFGNKAVPHVRSLLFSNDPEKRFYAVLLAGDVQHPTLLEPLGQRLFDADPQTRNATIDVFRKYRNTQGFNDTLKSLRLVASSSDRPVDMRITALQALAGVRDTESFDFLLNLLQYAEDAVANMARRVLVAITLQDFGLSVRKWAAWIKRNRGRDRIEWMIDGLTHSDETIREAAGTELQKTTGEYYGFHPTLPKRDRERIQKKYRSWWKERRI